MWIHSLVTTSYTLVLEHFTQKENCFPCQDKKKIISQQKNCLRSKNDYKHKYRNIFDDHRINTIAKGQFLPRSRPQRQCRSHRYGTRKMLHIARYEWRCFVNKHPWILCENLCGTELQGTQCFVQSPIVVSHKFEWFNVWIQWPGVIS